MSGLAHPRRLWMNASTATIYRHAPDRPMDEQTGEIGGNKGAAPSTWRFSIDVATSWEAAFFRAVTPPTRKIALPSAMVHESRSRWRLQRTASPGSFWIGRHGWLRPAVRFLGPRRGFGRSIEYLMAHEDFEGPVNIASPNPLPNREFMRILRRAWGAPIGLPASSMAAGTGRIFSAHGDRAYPKKPPRGSRPSSTKQALRSNSLAGLTLRKT
jgi:uncharacterized protein